jgi:hypothetical protein
LKSPRVESLTPRERGSMEHVQVKRFYTDTSEQRVYGWEIVSVHEALKIAEPKMRCPECEGAVRLHRTSDDGTVPAHAEHRKRNPGCSLGDCFDGKPKKADKRID